MLERDAELIRPALVLSALVLVASLALWAGSGWSLAPVGAPVPPLFLPLMLCSSAVALLASFRAGHVAFVSCLVLVIAHFVRHPGRGPVESTARSNLLLSLATLQFFVWSFHSTFQKAQRLLDEQLRVITLRIDEHARLVKALVTDITRCQDGMATALSGASAVQSGPLRAQQEALMGVIRQARLTLVPPEKTALPSVPVDFRPRMLRWVLIINGVETALLGVRPLLTGHGPPLPALLLSTLSWVLLVVFRLRPGWRPAIAVTLAVACETAIVSAMFLWGFATPPPGTLFVITIAYHAILIGWRASALGIALVNLSVVAFVALQGAGETLGGRMFLLSVALCAVAMPGYWHLLDRRVARALDAASERDQELRRIEGFRSRVCGTLFHDVANLAQSMGMLVAFDEPLSHEEAQSFERLHSRLGKLVAATDQTMNDEGPISPSQLSPVPLSELFRDAQELFERRLHQKEQSLVCSIAEPLSVKAHPDLLRDSVLANLLSNAIKFSPPGAAIELSAARKHGNVEISVRDRGPGFPDQLADKLERHEKVFSTAGSAGESGLGLGLTLTREHLQRMGGNLTLRRPPSGGGEAVIQLGLA
jgi:signal transduction histidine kinase